jgi:hypothetical protein
MSAFLGAFHDGCSLLLGNLEHWLGKLSSLLAGFVAFSPSSSSLFETGLDLHLISFRSWQFDVKFLGAFTPNHLVVAFHLHDTCLDYGLLLDV